MTVRTTTDMPDVKQCRSCQARVMFVRSATTGNYLILDADPCQDGNVAILAGKAHVFNGSLFEDRLPEDEPKYKDHHATCPQAAEWRKKRTGK